MIVNIMISAARTASIYIPAPAVIPVVIAQKRYKRSIGSFTAVRNRTMDNAPIINALHPVFRKHDFSLFFHHKEDSAKIIRKRLPRRKPLVNAEQL